MSAIDGANGWQTARYVVWPLAWPILVTTTPDWRPISYGLLTFLDEAGTQFHLQMAGSMITMAPILVLYFFTQRTFIEGIASSGIKG